MTERASQSDAEERAAVAEQAVMDGLFGPPVPASPDLIRSGCGPRDDLASTLAATPSDPGHSTDSGSADERADLVANCVFFILAGHATTTTPLCAGVHLLLARPDLVGRLREDPTRWDPCIEEILRYVSPALRQPVW